MDLLYPDEANVKVFHNPVTLCNLSLSTRELVGLNRWHTHTQNTKKQSIVTPSDIFANWIFICTGRGRVLA
jgi:hypothetical protein